MTRHEQPESSEAVRRPAGLRGILRFIRRTPEAKLMPSVPDIASQQPEDTDHTMHQERVGRLIMGVFNAVDARVAAWIDYDGNIREEIKDKLGPHRRGSGRHLNVEALDPAVRPYVQHSIFNVRSGGEDGEPYARYTLNCQIAGCTPSFEVEMPDGSLEARLYQGPDDNEFHNAVFKRIYAAENRVTELTTFTSNFRDPYLPNHPLTISKGWLDLSMSLCHTIYDDIDVNGNVTLLDGQSINAPQEGRWGIYSAADRTITPPDHNRFHYTTEADRFQVGYPGHAVAVPFETNLYDELRRITGSILGIEQ